ncbi:MAG: hypothetical protein H7Y17_05110 [Chlorobia bacterium]|nr:hypothetical protein [Fimbriimonadaceae bacterium]
MPKALIILIACLSALIFALLVHQVVDRKEFAETTVVKANRLQELRGDILHLDEVLTMAAYMAGTTSDPKWVSRYRIHDPVLAHAITEFNELLPSVETKRDSASLEEINNRLVALENQVLAQAAQKKPVEAQRILESSAYVDDKLAYKQKLNKLFINIRESLKHQIAGESRRINLSASIGGLCLALLLFLLFCAMRKFQAWRVQIIALIQKLQDAESAVVAERDHLEVRVAQRTLELHEALHELRGETIERKRAQEQAESATRAKSEFLVRMTHELKTPLNAVLGFASLLTNNEAVMQSEKASRYVRNIESGGEHMLSIVGNLLDLAKIESGYSELHFSDFEASEVVEDVVHLLLPMAEKRDIDFVTSFTAGNFSLSGDVGRIRQILMNLVGNCLKFTVGGDTVEISVKPDSQGAAILFNVTDHGPGLDPSEFESIFDQHAQRGSAEQRRQGNGLGLPLSRELARLHGGHLWVESAGTGCGCTFVLSLPIRQTAEMGRTAEAA